MPLLALAFAFIVWQSISLLLAGPAFAGKSLLWQGRPIQTHRPGGTYIPAIRSSIQTQDGIIRSRIITAAKRVY